MNRHVSFVVSIVLATALVAFAQQKPNFSGRWVVVSPPEAAGPDQTIVHTDAELKLVHDAEGGEHNLVYRLDGREQKSTMRSHDMDVVTLYRAEWKGDKLSITSATTYSQDRKLDQVMVWSLDDKGQLIIELTQTLTGQPTRTMRLVHRKQ